MVSLVSRKHAACPKGSLFLPLDQLLKSFSLPQPSAVRNEDSWYEIGFSEI